jgi:hypothetical protein
MPHAWGISRPASGTSHPAWQDPLLNVTLLTNSSYIAFDVHPSRKLYAYCSGNAIFTYDYEGLQLGVFIDFAYLPEPCSDIRFTLGGNYLMATSRTSSRLFRCDPQCSSDASAFAYSSVTKKYPCTPAHSATKQWGQGLRVYCPVWIPTTFTVAENNLVQEGRAFAGGVQNFGTSAVENIIYAAGSFRSLSEPSSWVWWAYADTSPSRATVYTFPAGVQIVGPLAYNERVRRAFVPCHDYTDATQRLAIYQIAVTSSGTRDTSKLTSGVSVFYTQLYSSTILSKDTSVTPLIPGFAVRLDTGVLSMVDEQEGTVVVFPCSAYASLGATCSSAVISTSYAPAAYKDIEFVGKIPYASTFLDPLTTPAKLFFTSTATQRAELYVQCARCGGGGITDAATEALSETDCFCRPGFMIVTSPKRGCELCRCRDGQFLDVTQGAGCTTGRELSMPGCLPCSATCKASGEFMAGSCDGSQTQNAMTCVSCTAQRVCPAASKLAVRVGATQTFIQSASAFRLDCTERRGLDCVRRQALLYPFDGNDLLEDLAPFARRLFPVSGSQRSSGPSLEVFGDSNSDDILYTTVLRAKHQRTAAAKFNATNHEFYRIPRMYNVFDPSLAVRVIPGARSLQGDARRIQSTIIWEQVFCFLHACMCMT